MKATANHPHYQPAKITCSCGVVHETFSTQGDYGVDVCSKCHPFYTGKQKLLDTEGRVERFRKKYAKVNAANAEAAKAEGAEGATKAEEAPAEAAEPAPAE